MSVGAFSLDQLMELAGLSVSQAGQIFGYCILSRSRLNGGKSFECIHSAKGEKCSLLVDLETTVGAQCFLL